MLIRAREWPHRYNNLNLALLYLTYLLYTLYLSIIVSIMGRPKGASTPLRAASDNVRCGGSSTQRGSGPRMDDSDESRTMSGIATPTSTRDDTPAEGCDADDGLQEASDMASRLAKKFGLEDNPQPALDDAPRFTKGSKRELLIYYRRCAVYASSPLPAAYWSRIECMMRDYGNGLIECKEEFWYTRYCAEESTIYSGAIINSRPAIISTARGFKHVKGAVISQFYTAPERRRRGHGTQFLKLLAEEMDGRTGEDRIEFSIVYGGPNTNFLKQCG